MDMKEKSKMVRIKIIRKMKNQKNKKKKKS